MKFESELREALQRKPAPDGFTEGVMAAIAREGVRRQPLRKFAAAAVAAIFLVAGTSGWSLYRAAERREGERAKAQLMLALRLTSKKLHETQQHVKDVSSRQEKQ